MITEIKFKSIWPPKYLMTDILFPSPPASHASTMGFHATTLPPSVKNTEGRKLHILQGDAFGADVSSTNEWWFRCLEDSF